MQAERKNNNLDFIRFFAAAIVIVGHSFALLGQTPVYLFGFPLHSLGVVIFFVVSGYLITDSWQRNPDPIAYFRNRALRIFPALIVTVAFSACVLGPLVSFLPAGDYFRHPYFAQYFSNIWLYTSYALPGVFAENVVPHAVNGSLWSLAPEFLCYVIVVAFGFAPRRLQPYLFASVFLFCATIGLYHFYDIDAKVTVYATDAILAGLTMTYFMAGALIRLWNISLNITVAFVLFAVLLVVSSFLSVQWAVSVGFIVLPYAVLTCGFKATPIIKEWGKYGDYSYGIYLYAFPIQQILSYLTGGKISVSAMIGLSFVLSVACGYASWRIVEEPFLRLKKRGSSNLDGSLSPGLVTPHLSKLKRT